VGRLGAARAQDRRRPWQHVLRDPASELDHWQKATANLPEDWIKDVGAKGQDGKMLLQAAKDLIKKYESKVAVRIFAAARGRP
jgi:hypothetical protein